nr:hypothetical protein [Bacillus mobilis]
MMWDNTDTDIMLATDDSEEALKEFESCVALSLQVLEKGEVLVVYSPLVSPTYQSELIQLYHNNMKRSYNGCFFILQKEPDGVRALFRSDDVFSAWELRKTQKNNTSSFREFQD